jgi:hypothetical protein
VIVGDPNQLRHVSFLARARQTQLADLYHLNTEPADRQDGWSVLRLIPIQRQRASAAQPLGSHVHVQKPMGSKLDHVVAMDRQGRLTSLPYGA